MYLVDTNVWLERLLEQKMSENVKEFFDNKPSETLFITDFSFHSIGIIMTKLGKREEFLKLVKDAFIDGAVGIVHLDPEDSFRIVQIINEFNLDFDDAYQYVSAEKFELTIVSFDADFDRTERGRKAPEEALKE